jgi:hypothetical protein
MRESLRQLVFLCRHDQVCGEMDRRTPRISATLGLVADTLEALVGPVNGLVVRVQQPDGTVSEVDAYSGCQALANLLRQPAVMDSVRQGIQSRLGSDPSATLSLVLGAATQGSMRYMPPAQSAPVTVSSQAPAAPVAPPPVPMSGPATASYPSGTRVMGGAGTVGAVHPAGTSVSGGGTEHRYPPGTLVTGSGASVVGPAVPPPTIPPETFSSMQSALSLEGEAVPQHASQVDAQLDGIAARLGRLVADPRLTFKIQGDAGLKAEVRAAISELQSL